MILDYNFDKKERKLDISYINEKGMKSFLCFNVNKFKTYYKTPSGQFPTWDGAKCDTKYTENPSSFDIKEYIADLPGNYQELISQKVFPKLYTFDIETAIAEDGSFPEPTEARQPITTISMVSPDFKCVVLGTRRLVGDDERWVEESFDNYLKNTKFYQEIGLQTHSFKYIYFDRERDMLEYFLKNVVANVPVLAGWNSILFDWMYITNRIKNFFPDLSINKASYKGKTFRKNYQNKKGEKFTLPMPMHTLILDMMDVIESEEQSIIKESMSLDYIAHTVLGVNKIKYNGTLQDLYNKDYARYVYYNAIDSILVQLINRKLKTLDHIYLYSLYTQEKIGACFSKIALTEALVLKQFREDGIKTVYNVNNDIDRGQLIGAYVREPKPGIHQWVVCNDFASLYPSTIRTCNLSFENFMGSKDIFSEEELEMYRKDPNYFVSVNGNVYKNDRDYAFRRIQKTLKETRDRDKYLAKQLDAIVMKDIESLGKNKKSHVYPDRIVGKLKSMGWDVECTNDLKKVDVSELRRVLREEIDYLGANEQAMKLMMNSMYGGCSHVAYYWYNMFLANDITGESRNLIHLMEKHVPEYMNENWRKMEELHKELGVKLKKEYLK